MIGIINNIIVNKLPKLTPVYPLSLINHYYKDLIIINWRLAEQLENLSELQKKINRNTGIDFFYQGKKPIEVAVALNLMLKRHLNSTKII